MLKNVTETIEKEYTIQPCPFCHYSGKMYQKPDGRYFVVCSNTKNCPGYNVRTRSFVKALDALFSWNKACGC
jgi:ssDNA-binding Zn-finger/Zn-ribbon topoisomerase 1